MLPSRTRKEGGLFSSARIGLEGDIAKSYSLVMAQSFQIQPLMRETFEHLFERSQEELRNDGVEVFKVDTYPGYPCRVSLADAPVDSEVLLLNFDHLPMETPFRSKGPIFVQRDALTATMKVNEIPTMLGTRLLSIRGYDSRGMMIDADVIPGTELEGTIESLFEQASIEFLHVHFAKRGCFTCQINRA